MSILSLILPVITAISLFFYIFSAERAYLPKKGTIEWIERASSKKRMKADIKLDFKWKDLIICMGIIIVYSAVYSFYSNEFLSFELRPLIAFICQSVFVGVIYIFAKMLFKNRVTAFFASAMAAANLTPLFSTNNIEAPLLLLLTVFFVILAAEYTWSLVPAGLAFAFAVNFAPASILFSILALCPAVMAQKRHKSSRAVLLWIIYFVVLPVAVLFWNRDFSVAFSFAHFTAQPVYDAVTAVCLIITVIHIFKDKSYPALFIAVGLIAANACRAAGYNFTHIFSCLAMAYPASIIIKRGKKAHRVFCIIFGSVMLLMFLLTVAHCVLKDYAPQFAFDVKDVFNYVFPFVTYY